MTYPKDYVNRDTAGKLGPDWLPGRPDYYLTDIFNTSALYGPNVVVDLLGVDLMTLSTMNRLWPQIRKARRHVQLMQSNPGKVPVIHFFKPRW